MFNNKISSLVVVSFCFLFLSSCGESESNNSSGASGQVIKNYSKVLSSQVDISALKVTSVSSTIECSGSSSNCTPDNLKGRIFAAGALLGEVTDDNNFNMFFMADSEDIISDPSDTSHPEGTTSFDLESPTEFSGLISIPSSADDMPKSAVITRLETYFDYIDAEVTLVGTDDGANTLDGTYIIRTVFRKTATAEDIAEGESMQLGDKLIRVEGDETFRWCDASGCDNTTRPDDDEAPLQDSNLLTIDANNNDQPGNIDYALYSIDLDSEVTVTYEQISDLTRLWTIDYNVLNAVGWTNTPENFTSEKDIVENFVLEFGCNIEDCDLSENRITATLTIGEEGSVEEAEESSD